MSHPSSIASVMTEKRKFSPPKEFSKKAWIKDLRALNRLRNQAKANPVRFWEGQAKNLHWFKPWKTAFRWKHPFAEWFLGGKINVSYNCLDRHALDPHKKHKAALIWEGEPGDIQTYTYHQLYLETCRFAHALRAKGIKKGDVVAIYMGMIPEAAIAMLACARIGATHNVVFGGFSGEALRDRILDSQAVALITQDGAYRRGNVVSLKETADSILSATPSVKNVFVVKRTQNAVVMLSGRDHWWHEVIRSASVDCPAIALDSEHPLFVLYTSGSTGKPKGILHTTGGYLTQVNYTMKMVFDLREDDLYFCTADVGWVTGHSYIVYGPLSQGATVFMYEGAPNFPDWDRFWSMIDRHKITVFYTAPTAIRAFMKMGEALPAKHDLSSLRLLGSVGEPINPEAWMWYYTIIGKKRCPIVDTWWQTETGAIMVSPIPGATSTRPGTATQPLPGVFIDVVQQDGTPCKANEGGLLVIQHPWPAMLRNIFGDRERYQKTYWAQFLPQNKKRGKASARPYGYYFTGDGARKDAEGNIWIMGRVDDVVNVSGHRLGTAEVESALVSHKAVAESAVVARPDEMKGNALVAFVTLKALVLKKGYDPKALAEELKSHVAREIGAIAKPDEVRFAEALPKTRSGKIMRRLLREIATGAKMSGDTTTLEDFSVLEKLRHSDED